MSRRPPEYTRPATPFPYATLFRLSCCSSICQGTGADAADADPHMIAGLDGHHRAQRTRQHDVARTQRLAPRGERAGEPLHRVVRVIEASRAGADRGRSEEHTSELQSLMRISYAVFCLKKTKH